MSRAALSLPDNPDELRAFAEELQSRNRVLEDEVYAKTLHIEHLKAQLAALRRARFGRSSEKLDRNIEQLELAIGELEEGKAQHEASRAAAPPGAVAATSGSQRQKGVPVRKTLPEHLPRERVDHLAACACPQCGGTRLTSQSRQLIFGRACTMTLKCDGTYSSTSRSSVPMQTITQPPLPSLPIERGIPGAGLLAHVITSKYCDHLPLHRQSVIYAREGIETICKRLNSSCN